MQHEQGLTEGLTPFCRVALAFRDVLSAAFLRHACRGYQPVGRVWL